VDFIHVFQVYSQHVSASGCYLQGVVSALEATQAVSVLWEYTDYDPSSVASWPVGQLPSWPVVLMGFTHLNILNPTSCLSFNINI
jgi:hypothetical protein